MFGLVLAAVPMVAVGAVVLVWVLFRSAATPSSSGEVGRLLAAARRRVLTALAAALAVFVTAVMVSQAYPSMLGLPILVAAPVGAAVGLVVYAVVPPQDYAVESSAVRQAQLVPRGPLSFTSFSMLAAPAVTMVAVVVFSVFTGVTGSADDLGLQRAISFAVENRGSTASPYAGWFYGVPLLTACALLLGATSLALTRISTVPAIPADRLAPVDFAWRRQTNRVVAEVCVAGMGLPLGGAALLSAQALGNARLDGVSAVWDTAFYVLLGLGILGVLTALISASRAVMRSLDLPRQTLDTASTLTAEPSVRQPQ